MSGPEPDWWDAMDTGDPFMWRARACIDHALDRLDNPDEYEYDHDRAAHATAYALCAVALLARGHRG